MSWHRIESACKLEGVERRPGHIVSYEGPMRPELVPLDPAEHSAWVGAGHWRRAGPPGSQLRAPLPRPVPSDRHE